MGMKNFKKHIKKNEGIVTYTIVLLLFMFGIIYSDALFNINFEWTEGIDWTWVLAGLVFTFIILRLLTNIVSEIFIFGIILGGIERYKYWLVPDLGFPEANIALYKFAAGVGLAWILARLIWVLADQWFKVLKPISTFIFGHNGPSKKTKKSIFG